MKGWVKSVQKDSANTVHWQTILVIGLSFAVLLVGTHIKSWGLFTLWVVMKITPGANALRIICRFQFFSISCFHCSCGWAESGQNRIPQIIETALQFISFNVDSCSGLFIIVKTIQYCPTSDYSKGSNRDVVRNSGATF
jgi:hypothetical protein